jgi:DNA-binding XRE family transcriptional regulator
MNHLVHFREKAGIFQADLAEESGVSQTAISLYERGIRNPREKTAVRLINVLVKHGVSCTIADVFPFLLPHAETMRIMLIRREHTRQENIKKNKGIRGTVSA